MDVDTVSWFLCDFLLIIRPNFSPKHERVNGNMGSSGIGLHSSSHEALREE